MKVLGIRYNIVVYSDNYYLIRKIAEDTTHNNNSCYSLENNLGVSITTSIDNDSALRITIDDFRDNDKITRKNLKILFGTDYHQYNKDYYEYFDELMDEGRYRKLRGIKATITIDSIGSIDPDKYKKLRSDILEKVYAATIMNNADNLYCEQDYIKMSLEDDVMEIKCKKYDYLHPMFFIM